MLGAECGWCMVDALLKQGEDLGVPDAKSGLDGVRNKLSFGSEKWEGISSRSWRVVQRNWLGCGGCVSDGSLAGGARLYCLRLRWVAFLCLRRGGAGLCLAGDFVEILRVEDDLNPSVGRSPLFSVI